MPASLIGPRVRERRRALGFTQAGLAARVGISASYLNLIEANKRGIGGALLQRIASELGLELGALDGAPERRLLADLAEVAGEPLLAELRLDPSSVDALAGSHAPWGKALVHLHRAVLDRDQAVNALSDRLSQDPFLGDAVHNMLTRVSAIRSSSEILETVADLDPARRDRFVAIIASESRRLADVAQALAAFFDTAHAGRRSITPVEEVDDFLFDRGNHFPGLELAAEALHAQVAADRHGCDESALAAWLERACAVKVSTARPAGDDLRAGATYDEGARVLSIDDRLAPGSRRFLVARFAAERFEGGRPVDAELAGTALLTSEASRRRAQRVLASYLASAALLPYEAFRSAAIALRYDVEALAQRFDASFEQVCHRLVTLRRPGAEGVPFGFMRVDAAGYLTKRFAIPHLPLPRHGNACPLWASYGAFQSPGTIVRQLAAFPAGHRFLFVARTVEKSRPAYGMPRRLLSVMLACDALHADQTVYADGLDVSSSAPAIPVGPNCRVCTRAGCAYREEDPIIDA